MNRITEDNIEQYLLAGESDTLKYKRLVPSRLDKLEPLISAFANTRGGAVIFGVNEQEPKIVGVSVDQINMLKSKFNVAKYKKYCTVYTVQIGDKQLAILEVEKTRANVYVKGVAYTRIGDKIFSKVGNIRSKYLKDFIEEIQYHNRNPKDVKALELLNDISTNPERTLLVGTSLYRGRVIRDMTKVGRESGFWGYGKKDSFVPPAKMTRDLRANYRYIPYLYCANHPYTAMVEVRPRLGSNVSIATIEVHEKLTLLDFTLKTIPLKMSETKLNLFADLSMLFSKPVTSDDDILDYIPTQYIAEVAKQLGYDGIAFRSSLTPELDDQNPNEDQELDRYNVVVFNYHKCSPVKSNIINVTRNYLECEQADFDTTSLDIHTTLLDMHF